MNFSLPANILDALLDGSLAVRGWGGRIDLQVSKLSCDWVGRCAGAGAGNWQEARATSLSPLVLGDYRLGFKRPEPATPWSGTLAAERGPLWINLTASVGNRQLDLNGTAWIDKPAREALGPLLSAIGPYDPGQQRYTLRFSLPLAGSKQ